MKKDKKFLEDLASFLGDSKYKEEIISKYDNLIKSEKAAGKKIKYILKDLGDPELIANEELKSYEKNNSFSVFDKIKSSFVSLKEKLNFKANNDEEVLAEYADKARLKEEKKRIKEEKRIQKEIDKLNKEDKSKEEKKSIFESLKEKLKLDTETKKEDNKKSNKDKKDKKDKKKDKNKNKKKNNKKKEEKKNLFESLKEKLNLKKENKEDKKKDSASFIDTLKIKLADYKVKRAENKIIKDKEKEEARKEKEKKKEEALREKEKKEKEELKIKEKKEKEAQKLKEQKEKEKQKVKEQKEKEKESKPKKEKVSFKEKFKNLFKKKERKVTDTPQEIIEEVKEEVEDKIGDVTEIVTETHVFESRGKRFRRFILKTLGVIITCILAFVWLWVTVVFFASVFAYLDGIKFIGIVIAAFSVDLLIFWIVIMVNRAIFKKKMSLVLNIIIVFLSLVGIAYGSVKAFKEISAIEHIEDVSEKYTMTRKLETYDLSKDTNEKFIVTFNSNYNTQYVIKYDKNLKNKVKIETRYYECYYDYYVKTNVNGVYVSLNLDDRDRFSVYMDDIKEGKIYDNDELARYTVKITVNPNDVDRIAVQ